MLLTGVIGVAAPSLGGGLSAGLALALAVSFGFSSTVLAAKVLDGNRELRAVHGRVAIGILIVQDVVAVVLLAFVNAETPSPFAALLLLACRSRGPSIAWLLARCGHGELLVLFGAALAIGGGEAFAAFGLSAELGALLLGTMLADHKRAQELTNVLWGLEGAVPRRLLPEHRLQRPADVGLDRQLRCCSSCCCRSRARSSSCC